MEEKKKPWLSATLWFNLVVAGLALAWPTGSKFIAENPQLAAGIVTGLNVLLRYFKTSKSLK